jgi:CRP/FNR family transcriptional regulator, anaerobic regulatory protein
MNINDLINNFTEEERQTFEALFQRKTYPNGHIVLKEGQIANKLYLIEKGSFRSFFIKDGNDITDFFFFENSFATDFASFYGNKPSLLNLVCQEEVEVLEVKKSDLLAFYQTNIKFNEIGRITAEYAFLLIEERLRLLHTESLEVKYNWMIANFPFVFQRVPQYHIASFLGVKPQSLSRIRAKIAGKIY